MKKTLIRALCVMLCFLICLTFLVSCKSKPIYELGPYDITENDYRYLAGTYNRQILDSAGLFGYSYDNVLNQSTGATIGDTLDQNYTSSFTASVLSLLYSQMMFDKYKLKLDDETLDLIESNIKTIATYYGNGSEQEFDLLAKKYGFDSKALRKVYTMKMKQTMLVNHLYGENGENISTESLDEFYKNNYMFFQTIVINTTYRLVEKEVNGEKVTTTEALSKEERQKRLDIASDLTNLFINENPDYVYKVIDPTLSYEELYKLYSDDTAYPQGCYSKYPTSLSGKNAITAASLLIEGDVGKIVARRPVSQDTIFEIGNEQIKPDTDNYLEYGYVFVKRMSLEDQAYRKDVYKSFFTSFISDAKSELFGKAVQDYILNECNFELEESEAIDEIPLSSVYPNDLDYNFFYGSLGKQESSSK